MYRDIYKYGSERLKVLVPRTEKELGMSIIDKVDLNIPNLGFGSKKIY